MTKGSDHLFLTVTVAEIYERQGKLQRAKDILQALLTADPTDARALKHLERVQAQVDALALVPPPVPGTPASDGGTHSPADWISLRIEAGMLECQWNVTPEGRLRAEQQVEVPSTLNLRQAHFASDTDPTLLDVPLDDDCGTLALSLPAAALVVSVALGLGSAQGHFVAIAHSPHISLVP